VHACSLECLVLGGIAPYEIDAMRLVAALERMLIRIDKYDNIRIAVGAKELLDYPGSLEIPAADDYVVS